VLIAVCTLNEAENIGDLIAQLRSELPAADVLVIDDNSSDQTGQIVAQLASCDPSITLRVRLHERGLGTAIRDAMQSAIDQHYDVFLNLDADFSHPPARLPALLDRFQQRPVVDVVIGSRYVPGGAIVGWPLRRRMISRAVNRFATLCLRLPVQDCSGSMRCYRVSALKHVDLANLRSSGYSVLEEILLKLHRGGATFAEVPITFTERQLGESKLTIREALRSAWRIAIMAIAS
jgi:dolichol-phosphate mannosyltransferase